MNYITPPDINIDRVYIDMDAVSINDMKYYNPITEYETVGLKLVNTTQGRRILSVDRTILKSPDTFRNSIRYIIRLDNGYATLEENLKTIECAFVMDSL